MRLRVPALAAILVSAALTLTASAATPPTASGILAQAKSQARSQHKKVLAIFSASWCGPCHMFEGFLDDAAIHPIIDSAFVLARFDVGERPNDPHHADTPGAVSLRASLGGATAGYPFIVILDPSGKPVVNSLRPDGPGKPPTNIGYPDLPVEIDWFMHMLQVAAPTLPTQQTAAIHTWLQHHSHS